MMRAYTTVALTLTAFPAAALELRTATTHPIQYYVDLPESWTAAKTWPVVFNIEAATRDFAALAKVFHQARGSKPFIIVTPLVITNGGARYREAPSYRYTEDVWARVQKEGGCRFDTDGLEAIAKDVRQLYLGEDRYFLTGLEAAGHTIWMQVFTRPERLRGAAIVAPNYQARCLSEIGYSNAPARETLPVRILGGSADEAWAPGKPFYDQTSRAKLEASARGYRAVGESVVDGKGHEPLAEEVLAYFESLLASKVTK